ncbi:uncharacterized protein LOC144473332 [Augochlora pura]
MLNVDNNKMFFTSSVVIQIVLVADIVEKMFIEKDFEMRKLRQRLRIAESALEALTRDSNTSCLKAQLNEKCRLIEEIKQQMSDTRKDLLEKQDTLIAEGIEKNKMITCLQKQIATLQEQYYNASMQIQFNEDIIKEMRKKLKRTMDKCLYTSIFSCFDNCPNAFDIDAQEVESVHKCYKSIYSPTAFSGSINRSNYISFLQNYVENNINSETENLSTMKSVNLKNFVNETMSCPQNKIKLNKYFHNIDKKLMQRHKLSSLLELPST